MNSGINNSTTSPQVYARTGGILYLIMIVLGIISELVVSGKVVVSGNAVATAANLKSMESLWRFGVLNELMMSVITVVISLILYVLTRPVSKNLALLALFFGLLATAVGTAYSLQLLEALFPLGGAEYLKAFTTEQLATLSYLAIKSHSIGFGISLLLFGPFFLITGYLIFKSGYLPKAIGILYLLPGFSYSISSLTLIMAPGFADKYYFIIAGPAIIGELALSLWLLIKGVNLAEWELRTKAGL